MSVHSSIGIAGAGRVGQALARLLLDAGEPVIAIASRTREHAIAAADFVGKIQTATYRELPQYCSHVVVAVPDRAIGCVARALAQGGMIAGVALHTSGSQSAEVLEPLALAGVACGSLHPLQTVASPQEGLQALRNIAFAIDGDEVAVQWAEHIVQVLQGQSLRINPRLRPIYHAAAVMASNYVIATTAAAVILMEEAGVDEAQAREALAPLARTSLENVLRLGSAAALTGPVSRGDSGTIQSHLAALATAPEEVAALYRAAALMTLQIARAQGLDAAQTVKLAELLKTDLPKTDLLTKGSHNA